MTVVVDASVAVKWLVEEDGSEPARRLAATEVMAAPELLFIECANVLRTKARFGQLDAQLSRRALAALAAMPIRSVSVRAHAAEAHALALELNRSAYDALYLAVALSEHARLVTADPRFAQAVQAHPAYSSSISLLAD